ncbi:MAG: hypothetical protein Q9159_005450 [Coniocarpon cinnabarinum]
MSTDYNYDEQGQFFPYFVVTVAALFTIPTTYSVLKPSKELESTGARIESQFAPDHEDLILRSKQQQRRRERKLKRMLLSALGWITMAYMVYLMVTVQRSTPKIWDPYEILGLSRSASESQIRKHYKKLSITQHPDKKQPDASRNETIESINEAWVEVVKAYKTLTDEEVRNNYIQYGHPDGKQSFSIGIALPQFLVQEGNGKYVLLLYAALLGVVLPWFLGRWWYGTRRSTRDGILVESAGKLFREYDESMDESGIVSAISTGHEYDIRLKLDEKQGSLSRVESKVIQKADAQTALVPLLSPREQETILTLSDEKRRKIVSLIWAHLNRVELDDPVLNEQKFEAAPVAFSLNEAFQSITLAWGTIRPLLSSYRVSQCLIQAVPPAPTNSPLLQLPYFTTPLCQHIAAQTSDPNMTATLHPFLSLPDDKRRSIIAGNTPPLLTPSQYDTAMLVASQLPAPRIEHAFFKVVGEKHLTPSSLIQFVVKVRFVPPTIPFDALPTLGAGDLDDPDPKEGDLQALKGKTKRRVVTDAKTGKEKVVFEEEDRIQPPLVHAPYFARDHAPRWRVFLADTRQGKVAVPPFSFAHFDNHIFKKNDKGEVIPEPTLAVQTLRMQFQAPPQVGDYHFTCWTVCDSYIGCDGAKDVVMRIEEPSKAEEVEEDEVSEPEEGEPQSASLNPIKHEDTDNVVDSIAGQMAAMKGGAVKKSRVREVMEDQDEESSSEEDDDESDTDTETDTDEE